MKVERVSTLSGDVHVIEINVTQEELDKIESGKDLMEKILPHLNKGEKEFLTSGITVEEWNKAYGEFYDNNDDQKYEI